MHIYLGVLKDRKDKTISEGSFAVAAVWWFCLLCPHKVRKRKPLGFQENTFKICYFKQKNTKIKPLTKLTQNHFIHFLPLFRYNRPFLKENNYDKTLFQKR